MIEVFENSLFDQLGLKVSDKLLTFMGDSFPLTTAALLLASEKDFEFTLDRGGKVLKYIVSFKLIDQIKLEISKKQFNETLPELLKTLQILPVVKEAKVIGVKLAELAPQNVFSLMGFKNQDILTHLNNQPLTNTLFKKILEEAQTPFQFEYLRNDKPEQIKVLFADG